MKLSELPSQYIIVKKIGDKVCIFTDRQVIPFMATMAAGDKKVAFMKLIKSVGYALGAM